jgi:hypothetical protein
MECVLKIGINIILEPATTPLALVWRQAQGKTNAGPTIVYLKYKRLQAIKKILKFA